MSELRDLYQEVILDHGRRPRNHRAIAGAPSAKGHNPLCGDRVTVYARVEDGVARDVAFEGTGCAISQASASLMTEAVRGKRVGDVDALFERFHDLVTGKGPAPGADDEVLGKLAVFAGVSEFPMRVKCATLPWHTLKAAFESRPDPVTTE
jgi:nitrogen fixation NifU-like protein